MPSPSPAASRSWSLAAAISAVAVFGLGIGQFAPMLSLVLDTRGIDPTLNGLNAAASSVGIVLGPLLAPRGVRVLGINRFLILCFVLDIVTVLALKLFDTLDAWFVLRFVLGLIGSNIFTASEAWINRLAGAAGRGRVLGLYAALLSAGFGLGPLLLTLTGISGWLPFAVNAGITGIALLPLIASRDSTLDLTGGQTRLSLGIARRAPLIFLTVALFGLFEFALMTLLPVWGLRHGMDARAAAGTVSAVYLGAIALQVPVGWMSDRYSRRAALLVCGVVGLAGAALLVALSLAAPVLFGLLFVWGGIVAAIYPVALSMAGDRFPADELVAVNAVVIIAYGIGSLAGPVLGGVAMDVWNPQGLPALFVVLFALFLLLMRFATPSLRE